MSDARRFVTRVAMIAGLAWLLLFTFLVFPDLFLAIPWRVRKVGGFLAFFGFCGVFARRLWTIRPGDELPLDEDEETSVSSASWPPWVLAALVASMSWPLLAHPEGLPFGDWDYYATKYEAARRSILDYRQFPWWDPWTRGGFPLAANPLCGVSGVAMPLVLAFGTTIGLRLAVVACFLLAAEGTRRLARLWLGDPVASAAAGLIYALNGGVLMATVAAYDIPMGYAVLPWMLYYVFRLDRGPSAGVGLGFWGAFNVLNGIAYFTVYVVLIAGIVWLRAARRRTGPARRQLIATTVLALGISLALAGWRIATTLLVGCDFPRVFKSAIALYLINLPDYMIFHPRLKVLTTIDREYFWETGWYVGPVVLVLVAASLRRGWRWWHTLGFLCGWLALGSLKWYEPGYWLSQLPVFSSMHIVTRWRFMAGLGVSLAAASTIAAWRASGRPGLIWLAHAAIAAIAVDYLSYGFEILPAAFSVPATEVRFPGPPLPTGQFVQVEHSDGFAATARGYGVVHGYEPLLGYDRTAPTLRKWPGHPEFKGEHWTERGPVAPIYWSPNRIELRVRPGEVVHVNQNPGFWWWANGRQPPGFAAMRCVETRKEFEVSADETGRLVLEIQPRGLGFGLGLHVIGVGLIALVWLARPWWKPLRQGEPAVENR
jgi:hypothetical protein